jgi:sodium transport system permease protein
MKNLILVLKKELYRVFSDRKLIISLFIVPAILMFAIYSLIGTLAKSMNSDIESHTSKTYIVNATDMLEKVVKDSEFGKNADIKYLSDSEYASQKTDLEEQIRNGDADLIVVVQKDFDSVFSAYKGQGDAIPNINIVFNSTENYSQQAYSVFSNALNDYRTKLLGSRIGNLEQLTVFNQTETEIVKESKAGTQFIAMMLPYMIMIMLFSGAMSISVDAFAGEKERGTLASMLVSPIRRTDIAMGKVIALAIIAALSSIVYAVSMIISMSTMGGSMSGMSSGFGAVHFDIMQIVQLGLMLIVLDYFFVVVIAVLSSFAKDTKSASTFVTPAYMVVLVSALLTMFQSGAKNTLVKYAIPLYGNAIAIQDITTGDIQPVNFFVSLGVTVLVSAILTGVLAKIFDSDKLMFNA